VSTPEPHSIEAERPVLRILGELREKAKNWDVFKSPTEAHLDELDALFWEIRIYRRALVLIADEHAVPGPAHHARAIVQAVAGDAPTPRCARCSGKPPAGFACTSCGSVGL
jgi:hypothetical protein